MKMTLARVSLAAILAVSALGLVLTSQPAKAATYNFTDISGGDTFGDGLGQYLSFDVTQFDATHVLFQFKNASTNTATDSFIGAIYFDDNDNTLGGVKTPMGSPQSVGTVNFAIDDKNFPQGENLFPEFETSFSYDKNTSASQGIQPGEVWGLTIVASLLDVISDLSSGALRIGYHLQGLPNDKSDSYVNFTTQNGPLEPVPVPAALPLLLGGLGALGWISRRQRRSSTKIDA